MHTVNCILITGPDRSHGEYELRGPLNEYLSKVVEKKIFFLKEFVEKAKISKRENEDAMVHLRTIVGIRDINDGVFRTIIKERQKFWSDYKDSMVTTPHDELFKRQKSMKIRQRILRNASCYPLILRAEAHEEFLLSFDAHATFVEIIRKIILKNRLLKVLKRLNKLTPDIIDKIELLIEKERRRKLRQDRQQYIKRDGKTG